MAEEHDEDGGKGRTVFGIGLPASVQAATAASRGAAAPAKPAPVVMPAPPAKAPAKPIPVVEARRGEEKRTIVGLPPGAGTSTASGARPVMSDATMPDVRDLVASASGSAPVPKRDTGEYEVSGPHESARATRVQAAAPGEGVRVARPPLKLVAGKPIPGTRYKLLRWLGEGGMGVVYEAEHIDIERRVALKILRAELSDRSDTAQVFRDEARAAARAGSKNIVEIFDFGELPDGRLFFCMELLSGTDLASMVDGTLDFSRCVAILRQCCKGLGAAHKAGIVHRDIKPENIILVQHEGRRDMAKIVDFGVSAMLDAQSAGGPIAGTPQYMSPEQINGGDFDGRLDVYALGCVMYEMLVGRPVFTDENLADVLLAHLNRAPTRPTEANPERRIPRALDEVVMKCLAKEPAGRYADMGDLEAALCEAQIAAGLVTEWDDLPIPDVDPERRATIIAKMPSIHGEPQRRRWLWPAVAAVGAAAVTGVALMLLRTPDVTPEVQAKIDELSKVARDAASVGHYVQLPDDGGPTALHKVEELEKIEGAGEALADTRGVELRKEFSNQLLTVGDKFWESEPTRPLSRDYYAWAVMFDPNNERALTRSARSKAEIDDLALRSGTGKLSAGEKSSAEVMVALLQPDAQKRDEGVKRAYAKARAEASLSTQAVLLEATRGAGVKVAPDEGGSGGSADPDGGTGGATKPPVEPETPPVVEPDPPPEAGKKTIKGPGKKKTDEDGDEAVPEGVKRDPVKAAELASQGKAALAGGRRDEAESLFNQAIGYDRRNAEALIGLSDIFFDRGSADKAARFAEKAVAVAPNNGSYRLKLGDAYYSALRYRDALTHYEKAQELGEPKAAQRIAKVKAKLGG